MPAETLPAKSPFYTPEHLAFRDAMRRFVAREISPHVDAWDEAESFPVELYRKAAEIGLNDKGEPVPVITLANMAPTYGYLSSGRLRIVETDTAGKEVFRRNIPGPELQQAIGFGLVAAGQTRKIQIPLVLPTQGGRLEAQFTPDIPR